MREVLLSSLTVGEIFRFQRTTARWIVQGVDPNMLAITTQMLNKNTPSNAIRLPFFYWDMMVWVRVPQQ